jgi:hypothetical protein
MRWLLGRVGLLMVLSSAPLQIATGQRTGSVTGRVTDSVSGTPVVGVLVAIWCPDCYGRHPTDSSGRYRIAHLPAGSFPIEFHCPSVTGVGAEILQGNVTVALGAEAVIDARVPKDRCWEPAYFERTGIFRGYWTPGFESSAFRPCEDVSAGIRYPLLPGKRLVSPRAWAEFTSGAEPRSRMWPKNAPRDRWGNSTYFVVWHGVWKGPGTYGHMGVSAFSMIVDSVITLRIKGPSNCRPGGSSR